MNFSRSSILLLNSTKYQLNRVKVSSKCILARKYSELSVPEKKFSSEYDIVIVGGGMVGFSAAASLGKFSMK